MSQLVWNNESRRKSLFLQRILDFKFEYAGLIVEVELFVDCFVDIVAELAVCKVKTFSSRLEIAVLLD